MKWISSYLTLSTAFNRKLIALFVLAIVLSSLSIARESRSEENEIPGLQSVSIKVIGMSFIGIRYQKQAELRYTEETYALRYWLLRTLGFASQDLSTSKPSCSRQIADHDLRLKNILQRLEALKDMGEVAKCCDHPWTEIELNYFSRPGRRITLSYDFIEREDIGDLWCVKAD